MIIETEQRGDWFVISLCGAFVIREQYKIKSSFEEQKKKDNPKVAINLSETNYLDSSALGLIIKESNEFKEIGGKLILYGANDTLMDMFRMVNLEIVLDIMDELPE